MLAIGTIAAQAQSWLQPMRNFAPAENSLALRQHTESEKPFTVAGECGAFMGQQDGRFEAWIFPVKILSHMQIEAHVQGYDVPIDVNADAAEIDVQPDHTTITYAHIAFTLRETFFATQCGPQAASATGTGVMALFQIDSARPLTLTFSFKPEVQPMWPAPQYGNISTEWVSLGGKSGSENPSGPGWYMLHTDRPELSAAVAMPGTEPGILAPFQERPKYYPVQLILHYDPRRDRGNTYPLLMAAGRTAEAASKASLGAALERLNTQAAALYAQTSAYYAHFFDTRTTVNTPDAAFNDYFRWAEISIDQLRVRHNDETGLVAGFYSSGDSARPGFGWFFGRDSFYTLYAIDNYGDFPLVRQELEFLIARQRADGKMPHEYAQTAESVDWANSAYEYAAADSTPLFLMGMDDYVNASGDVAFLRAHWPAVEKAWNFERTHDTDGDGIYDNAQGTGWVESWPPAMPHQEIYLAALDQQASGAMARLSQHMDNGDVAKIAQTRAAMIAAKIPQEYAQPDGMYAFSYNGSKGANPTDRTATIFPSIAWWDGHYSLPHSDAMFERWASSEFSTDWGARDVSNHEPLYDPISYHQGSVWPLFTGWTSLAEYRTGRTLSGYAQLMQTANLTTAQDLGAVTELLSGDFFVPFGRSTSHQLWSSAMVLVPVTRGLFGISVDAPTQTVTIDPHLPAQWDHATVRHLEVGATPADLTYVRSGRAWVIRLNAPPGSSVKLASTAPGARISADGRELRIPVPPVEVGMDYGADAALPLPGARTHQMKVLRETHAEHALTLELAAPGGSEQTLAVRVNSPERSTTRHTVKWTPPSVSVEGGTLHADKLHLRFPAAVAGDGSDGYVRTTVRLRW
ncbi:MAG: amylo-alpha-1,6-glucosidase [Acidobacteriaceae bacterium]